MITLPTARPLTKAAVFAHFESQYVDLVAEIGGLLADAEAAVDAGDVALAIELMDAVHSAEADRDAIAALWTA
jgi:hypothetical protein